MSPEQRTATAKMLLDTPLFHELWNELENHAIENCLGAGPTEDAKRAAHAAEARAIRDFRTRLNSIVEEGKYRGNKAPA